MAEEKIDEDASLSSLHAKGNTEDNDPTEELPDFRFLAALTSTSKGQIPKRGEKDFEPHGTRHQDTILDTSRRAMHDALDYTRVHTPKSKHRAWYFGDGVADDGGGEAVENFLCDTVRGRGLEEDHVVMVENATGTHFRTMGKSTLGLRNARLWLLPEEALYLVERGNLDLWWPSSPFSMVTGHIRTPDQELIEEGDCGDEGFPLSLQAAYALLVGGDDQKGKVSLDRFTVFANLKRTGYVVLPAQATHDGGGSKPLTLTERISSQAANMFALLFGNTFQEKFIQHPPYGSLILPGLYRSYNYIYRRLALVPHHVPIQRPTASPLLPQDPFRVIYHVWKPTRIPKFAKSDPGVPDFRVAIISSRSTDMPTLTQLTSLLESTPWDPPNKEWKGPSKRYQRLKHGWRNVVLAVVDQGIVSYLRMGETAFGEEKLYESFDRGGIRGGKRGGGRGRGRGRGR